MIDYETELKKVTDLVSMQARKLDRYRTEIEECHKHCLVMEDKAKRLEKENTMLKNACISRFLGIDFEDYMSGDN